MDFIGKDMSCLLLQYLDVESLHRMSQTSRKWYGYCDKEWERRVKDVFDVVKHEKFDNKRSWSEIYMEHHRFADFTRNCIDSEIGIDRVVLLGYLWAVRCCLRHGDPVDGNDSRVTPFSKAVHRKYTNIALFLANVGADIFRPTHNAISAVEDALTTDNVKIIELYLTRGYVLDDGQIRFAAYMNAIRVITLLLHNNIIDGACKGKVLRLAVSRPGTEMLKLILANGADINFIDKDGDTVLHAAVYRGSVNKVRILLQNGADPTIKNKHGYTAKWYAVNNKDKEITKLFL